MSLWSKYKNVARKLKEREIIDGRKVYRNAYWVVIVVSLFYASYSELVLEETPIGLYLVYSAAIITYVSSILYYYLKNS